LFTSGLDRYAEKSDKVGQSNSRRVSCCLEKRLESAASPSQRVMNQQQASEITQILREWNDGNEDAKERLLPFVYDELKRQAGILMSRERADHTLQPTALVHEAFLRLSEQTGIDWKNRSHFYGIASRLMRQILVDHARQHAAAKRGSHPIHFSLDDVQIPVEERAGSILCLDEALERLEKFDEVQARIVEMRFFGGMNNQEIAESLGVSDRTVAREWETTRLWLYRELNR
jgi:RNA polymerase sigma-70 factor, ECF subfamily